jgi:Transcription factor WhiB
MRCQSLLHAIVANENHGIWGGLTEEERASFTQPQDSPARNVVTRRRWLVSAYPGRQ